MYCTYLQKNKLSKKTWFPMLSTLQALHTKYAQDFNFGLWEITFFSASTVVNKILHVGTKAHLHSRYIYLFFQV